MRLGELEINWSLKDNLGAYDEENIIFKFLKKKSSKTLIINKIINYNKFLCHCCKIIVAVNWLTDQLTNYDHSLFYSVPYLLSDVTGLPT